ncbi:MAG: alpha-L-fucosidase [Planctomycetota bacterium]|jgi:alpha-L-fucosidase
MRILTGLLCTIILLYSISVAEAENINVKYDPNWISLDKRPTPKWWTDAKFGIFIHWGPYAVPSFAKVGLYSEWYWHRLKTSSHKDKQATVRFHKDNYGPEFKYQDFAPMFRAELFEPDYWADVFLRSGAKYIVLTSKHHDGFCLWPSEQANKTWGRPWNSVDIGPKRDIVGDLTDAVRKKGLRMGLYYSLYEWYNPLWLTDKERYVTEHMHRQFKDVVSRYRPAVIFADGEWNLPPEKWRSEELLAWLFNESPCRDYVVVNDRWGKKARHRRGSYYTTEYGAGLSNSEKAWEENRGMGYSFGFSRPEKLGDYKSEREMILMLIDLVSRGGNFLLDIGPTADGRIPVIMVERLLITKNGIEQNMT